MNHENIAYMPRYRNAGLQILPKRHLLSHQNSMTRALIRKTSQAVPNYTKAESALCTSFICPQAPCPVSGWSLLILHDIGRRRTADWCTSMNEVARKEDDIARARTSTGPWASGFFSRGTRFVARHISLNFSHYSSKMQYFE